MKKTFLVMTDPEKGAREDNWTIMNAFEFARFMETDDLLGALNDAGAAALAFGFVHLRHTVRIERDGAKGTDAHAHAAADAAIAAVGIVATAIASN